MKLCLYFQNCCHADSGSDFCPNLLGVLVVVLSAISGISVAVPQLNQSECLVQGSPLSFATASILACVDNFYYSLHLHGTNDFEFAEFGSFERMWRFADKGNGC